MVWALFHTLLTCCRYVAFACLMVAISTLFGLAFTSTRDTVCAMYDFVHTTAHGLSVIGLGAVTMQMSQYIYGLSHRLSPWLTLLQVALPICCGARLALA